MFLGGDSDFVECSRKAIWESLRSKLNCSIVGFDGFKVNGSYPATGLSPSNGSSLSDLSDCEDQKTAGETFWIFLPLVKGLNYNFSLFMLFNHIFTLLLLSYLSNYSSVNINQILLIFNLFLTPVHSNQSTTVRPK